MSMRLWAWICWLVKPMFGLIILTFLLPDPWSDVGVIAILSLLPIGVAGGVFGALMVMDRWRMRCPLCGMVGKAGANKEFGMWVECPQCKLVRIEIKLSGPRFEKV